MKNVICKTKTKTKYLSSDLNIQIYYFIHCSNRIQSLVTIRILFNSVDFLSFKFLLMVEEHISLNEQSKNIKICRTNYM